METIKENLSNIEDRMRMSNILLTQVLEGETREKIAMFQIYKR